MKKNYFETILGTVIILFSIYAFKIYLDINRQNPNIKNIIVKANFLKLGGVIVGNDVKLRGIKIGVVSDVSLNDDYQAKVIMIIDGQLNLPQNSTISIESEGILGNKYISIMPGDDDGKKIENNGMFTNVKDYQSIEDQVSKIIFLATQ